MEQEMFHRILVGVDDGPAARAALERAIELVAACNGRLGLLSSAPEPTWMVASGPVALPMSRRQLCRESERWAQENVEAAACLVPDDVPIVKLVTHGDPAEALLAEAESGVWDLLVVGEERRRRRFRLHAPVGERLARQAATPVLVVNDAPAPVTPPPAPSPAPRGRLSLLRGAGRRSTRIARG
jgi:nucleotide-binding universal stress UspA family protein